MTNLLPSLLDARNPRKIENGKDGNMNLNIRITFSLLH